MGNDLRTTSMGEQTGNRITAFFRKKQDAFQAVRELRSGGFASDDIGLAVQDEDYSTDRADAGASMTGKETSEHDRSFWQEVKDFFTGNKANDYDDYSGASMRDVGWEENRANYYDGVIGSGGALVTVTGPRQIEARTILERYHGDLRESGFDESEFNIANTGTGMNTRTASGVNTKADRNIDRENFDPNLSDREQRIQLRGEMLRTYKDRVKRGEVRLRKEVVTENQTINVPVTREELVIERMPASGKANASGEIGTDREIRVPLEEDRVRVEKQQMVNEEVKIGKRQVQDTRNVTDNVRHEELRVEKEGDVNLEGENLDTPRRKKPAA
jgi:uncharacterized protein (TIGR02271 family)